MSFCPVLFLNLLRQSGPDENFIIMLSTTHVKTHSLFLPVDRLGHGWANQLEHGCWQTWTWLNWPGWTWLLTGLNMVVDRLEHGWTGQLEHAWLFTGLNMVELASLNMFDTLEHGWADQLEHGCSQALTWLSWPAWTWLFTGLFMHVEQTVHGLMNEQAWTTLLEPSW